MSWEGGGRARGMNTYGHGTGDPGVLYSQAYGVKGSSVCVTRPTLFRPETGSWNHRRFIGPARWVSSRFQPRPMQGEERRRERKWKGKKGGPGERKKKG